MTLLVLAAGSVAAVGATSEYEIDEVSEVGTVWSGHPVGFCLVTAGARQFVAYYDEARRMTVAARRPGETEWRFVRLGERIGWDSHNYITMMVDDEGLIHLSGNMHCVPLVYFRTSAPGDITTFERISAMTGRLEKRCTYPRFFRGPKKELLFTYRDGGSGNGNQIYNMYEPAGRQWRPLLEAPLTDGEGKMNAYLRGPMLGPDGYYHLCWVWRDTPDCATNHDLSYARSRDLIHWTKSDGTPIGLPMRLGTAEVVDAVPVGGGMINGNTAIGFDRKGRVVISYHKHDAKGHTQIYNARREEQGWKNYQASDWDYRWEFSGGGSISFEIRAQPVRWEQGKLVQDYSHKQYGSGTWVLDEKTLKPTGTLARLRRYPKRLNTLESDFSGMWVNIRGDSGTSGDPTVIYLIRWETLGRNRDRPRKGPLPAPSMLRVYKMKKAE